MAKISINRNPESAEKDGLLQRRATKLETELAFKAAIMFLEGNTKLEEFVEVVLINFHVTTTNPPLNFSNIFKPVLIFNFRVVVNLPILKGEKREIRITPIFPFGNEIGFNYNTRKWLLPEQIAETINEEVKAFILSCCEGVEINALLLKRLFL